MKVTQKMIKTLELTLHLIAMIFCLISFFMIVNGDGDTKIIKGDCYDRFGNKINDLTCEKEEKEPSSTSFEILTIVVFLMGIFSYLISILVEKQWQNQERY